MEILSLQFVQFALLSAFLVSICGGIVGSIIVSNKTVFLSGGVAHSAFGGVGLALYFGFNVMLGAAITSILMSLLLLYFIIHKKKNIDSFIAAAWAFGMALGVILIDITPGYGIDLMSYLFGSILAVSKIDIIIIAVFDVLLIFFICLYYREILGILYDETFCKLKNININIFLFFIYIFVSLGIVMSMNIAGLILVLAILSIPAYIASMFVNSLRAMMILSMILSFLFICVGFFVSYYYDLSIGACVVMSAIFGMIFSSILKIILRKYNG